MTAPEHDDPTRHLPREGDQLPEEAAPGQAQGADRRERARRAGIDPEPEREAPPAPATGNPRDRRED